MSETAPVVFVCGGGPVYKGEMAFPLDQIDLRLDRILETMPIGLILSRGESREEQKVLRWAAANNIPTRIVRSGWRKVLGISDYKHAMSMKPDVVMSFSGKWDGWEEVNSLTRAAGMTSAHSMIWYIAYARPQWIMSDNTIVRPDENNSPRKVYAA